MSGRHFLRLFDLAAIDASVTGVVSSADGNGGTASVTTGLVPVQRPQWWSEWFCLCRPRI